MLKLNVKMNKRDGLTFDGAISRPLLVAIIAAPAATTIGPWIGPWISPVLRALGVM